MSADVTTSARLAELLRMRRFLDVEIAAERQRLALGPSAALVRAAADLYGTTVEDVIGPARDHSTSRARQLACWLLRATGKSYPEIGSLLRCHHTTAVYACRAIDNDPARLALGRQLLAEEAAA